MIKFKIFIGTDTHPADNKANAWMEEHPTVKIIDMRYAFGGWYHSICIMYDEYL